MALGSEQMSNLFRFRFRFDCDAIRCDCDCDAIVYLAIRVLNEGCGGGIDLYARFKQVLVLHTQNRDVNQWRC